LADTLTQEQIDAMLSSVLSGGDTASLDTQTEKQIQDALDRLIKGRTTKDT